MNGSTPWKRRHLRRPTCFLLCFLLAAPVLGQEPAADSKPPKESLRDRLTDDEDGRFDVSDYLFSESNFNFLPVPILITEPAVGYGGGLATVWFHERPDRSSGRLIPPSVSVAAAFLTSDGSWGGGGGHFHSWKADTWRLAAFGGRFSLDLESAGIASDAADDQAIEYSIDSDLLLLEGSRKVSARTRIGLRYIYADSDVGIGSEQDRPASLPDAFASTIGGLGLFLGFDSRDNVISPTQGHRLDLRPAYYGELFGGDDEYVRVDAVYTGYWKRDPLGFAVRLGANWIDDGAPFYAKPFISLRGVPAAAFLGQEVLSAEPEIAWNLTSRWTLVAFAGAGRATNDFEILGERDRDVYAGGAGFRYLFARVLGMRAGLDFAWSSEGDSAFYIVVGSPWP
jgi:hypothetical protein